MPDAQPAAAAVATPPPPPPPAAAVAAAVEVGKPAAAVAEPIKPVEVKPAVAPAAEPAKPAVAAVEAKPAVPGDTKHEAAKPAAEVPPAEIEIKPPEGSHYDAAVIESFKATAKQIGLNSKQAQALLEMDAKAAADNAKKFTERVQAARSADEAAIKADPEFGGAKYEQTVTAARSAMKQFFGEDASKLLEQAGMDKHPALVKGLARIRKAIAEDPTKPPGSQVVTQSQRPQTLVQRGASVYSDPKVKGGKK